ncbi:phosphotransferase system IIC component [Streptomyces sp. Mg1]|nr:phosphotransferase system IIC component [Streptomyces sp. Mg1]
MSATSATAVPQPNWRNHLFQALQKMGRSLQLPIAVLPAAGILNRFGQPDMFGADGLGWTDVAKVMAAAGGALLNADLGLPLLFCVGVAIGMAKKADGSTALAAVVGFLVYRSVLRVFPTPCPTGTKDIGGGCLGPDDTFAEYTFQNPGVFGGIVMGLLAAWFWQRYHRVKLVDWLGFFNGRRLVPIIMTFVAIAFASLCLWIWPPIGDGLESFSDWLVGLSSLGSGIFGVANRALLVIGLHQFLNVPVWFQFGSYTKPDGQVVHGDIPMFLAGDPNAGLFLSGFFPDHDVRPARRGAGHHPLREAGAAQGGGGPDAVGGPDLVRHGHHGAAGVLVPLRGARAVRGPRAADGRVDGGDLGAGRARRLQLLGRTDRLRHQLGAGDQAVADHSDRAVLRRRLLRRLPVRDHEVRHPDSGAGDGRGDRGDGGGQHQGLSRPPHRGRTAPETRPGPGRGPLRQGPPDHDPGAFGTSGKM